MKPSLTRIVACGLALGLAAAPAVADDLQQVQLVLKAHHFTPEHVTVPAGRKVRILLINEDAASEEFDSTDLGREEDVTPHGRTSFTIGPLKPGDYSFMGELHPQTAGGVVTAVADPATAAGG